MNCNYISPILIKSKLGFFNVTIFLYRHNREQIDIIIIIKSVKIRGLNNVCST